MRSVAFALLFVFIAVTSFAAVPRLIMPSDDGDDAVVLSAAAVRVTIRGHLARTEYELTFRNRLDRVVGGDFVFPLPPDAEVSGLGLYFDGRLRHAVAVERVQAKRAYEETVHRFRRTARSASSSPATRSWWRTTTCSTSASSRSSTRSR